MDDSFGVVVFSFEDSQMILKNAEKKIREISNYVQVVMQEINLWNQHDHDMEKKISWNQQVYVVSGFFREWNEWKITL